MGLVLLGRATHFFQDPPFWLRRAGEGEQRFGEEMTGEEVAGPAGPKLLRLLYFVGAGFFSVAAINKWREIERKSIEKQQQHQQQLQEQSLLSQSSANAVHKSIKKALASSLFIEFRIQDTTMLYVLCHCSYSAASGSGFLYLPSMRASLSLALNAITMARL
ncbi:uncharacterized protein LOC110812540 [Carica papaya]|uniref:uncharacterized protein LOC110812540 n=1 Tax=Carica papaya TaxID=3649 RepID=UPI000B8D15AC|nr:uncharacterized protein LOC110812540 [Carica papaya]